MTVKTKIVKIWACDDCGESPECNCSNGEYNDQTNEMVEQRAIGCCAVRVIPPDKKDGDETKVVCEYQCAGDYACFNCGDTRLQDSSLSHCAGEDTYLCRECHQTLDEHDCDWGA